MFLQIRFHNLLWNWIWKKRNSLSAFVLNFSSSLDHRMLSKTSTTFATKWKKTQTEQNLKVICMTGFKMTILKLNEHTLQRELSTLWYIGQDDIVKCLLRMPVRWPVKTNDCVKSTTAMTSKSERVCGKAGHSW